MESTGIIAQSLRSVNLLVDHPLILNVRGYLVTVPEPTAYIVQKLMINAGRPEPKKQRDLDSVDYLLRNLEKYGYTLNRVREIFDTLTPKLKAQVRNAAESLSVDFSVLLS